MSFAHLQAEYLISQLPWTSDDSFENVIFEWLKLVYQHPCKKKQDFENSMGALLAKKSQLS